MHDDEEGASPPAGGEASWIDSLGLPEEEQKLIRHALDMADAVIRREPVFRAEAAVVGSDDPGKERERADPLVREGPSGPIEAIQAES